MKILITLSAFLFIANICLAQDTIPKQIVPADSISVETTVADEPVNTIENVKVDTVVIEKVKTDTVIIEKVKVDTVYLPAKEPSPTQTPVQETEPTQAPVQEAAPAQQKTKNDKVYTGGYANFSFGKYTVIGIEPLIAYKLLPRFSVGTKLSYEYVKNKNFDPTREGSNFGVAAFSRLRIGKRLYAHVEYSEMNYKLYSSSGQSSRQWISFLYVGGGISLPVSKRVSFNAEILWDVLQDDDSPYKTVEPFVSVGIVAGF